MTDDGKYGEYSSEQGSRPETVKTAITFLLIGGGIGALLSLLFAPKSGLELRQSMRNRFDDALLGLSKQTSRLRRRTGEIAGQAREKVLPIRKTR